MKFGLFGGAREHQGVEDGYRVGYNSYIEAVIEAEALGYYSNFLVEHHFSGLGQVSASLNLLTYIAAKTSTIRLGPAVGVIPWHNPMLIALLSQEFQIAGAWHNGIVIPEDWFDDDPCNLLTFLLQDVAQCLDFVPGTEFDQIAN